MVHVDSRRSVSNTDNIELTSPQAACYEITAGTMRYLAEKTGGIYLRAAPHIDNATLTTNIINKVVPELCDSFTIVSLPNIATQQSFSVNNESSIRYSDDISIRVSIDAIINIGYSTNGVKIEMPPGNYIIKIIYTDAQFDNEFYAPLKVSYKQNMITKNASFIDKGKYNNLIEASDAYVDSAINITHSGGLIKLFIPVTNTSDNKGKINIEIIPTFVVLSRNEINTIKSSGTMVIEISGTLIPISFDGDPGTQRVKFVLDSNLLVPTKHSL